MLLKKGQMPIVIFHSIVLIYFATLFIAKANYEFIMYLIIVLLLTAVVIASIKKVKYSNVVLWGLAIWSLLHLGGGGIVIGDHVLYAQMLIPICEKFSILKYDQAVHAFGFGAATLLAYELLKPSLKPNVKTATGLSIIIVMAGLGLGALNEIIEFIATVISPENGVGGYINNSLDLVFNLIGALVALVIIKFRER